MKTPDLEFRPARAEDLPTLVALLKECGLPSDDLTPAGLSGFEVALGENGSLVGMAGLDFAGGDALLRSVAVVPARRGSGLGAQLAARREAAARQAGVGALYLLTTTAADYFRRRGYADVARAAVPPAIAGHAQFRSLCPASAQCLEKSL
jgi:amino-acid N-acetyltransferase